MKILVTGSAGFIGFHMANKLMDRNDEIVGLDSLNDYYDVNMKFDRLELQGIERKTVIYNTLIKSTSIPNFSFIQLRIEDKDNLNQLFDQQKFDIVVNLAAQAGVRYSLTNAQAYIDSNLIGFAYLLECCRHHQIKHLVYASSSSVYGLNESVPFYTSSNVDHPISLYAATKKSNELLAHVYSHLFHLPTTGLRFFTVYGPWGRPDMALFLFTKAIIEGKPINVFNNGEMIRDFTFVDDIVEGLARVVDNPPAGNPLWDATQPNPSDSTAPYKIYNIGNNKPVTLLHFIEAIEEEVGLKAIKHFLPLQAGDVPATYADVSDLINDIHYTPNTMIKDGIKSFVNWYRDYFRV